MLYLVAPAGHGATQARSAICWPPAARPTRLHRPGAGRGQPKKIWNLLAGVFV
jgi:hypothetical protein